MGDLSVKASNAAIGQSAIIKDAGVGTAAIRKKENSSACMKEVSAQRVKSADAENDSRFQVGMLVAAIEKISGKKVVLIDEDDLAASVEVVSSRPAGSAKTTSAAKATMSVGQQAALPSQALFYGQIDDYRNAVESGVVAFMPGGDCGWGTFLMVSVPAGGFSA